MESVAEKKVRFFFFLRTQCERGFFGAENWLVRQPRKQIHKPNSFRVYIARPNSIFSRKSVNIKRIPSFSLFLPPVKFSCSFSLSLALSLSLSQTTIKCCCLCLSPSSLTFTIKCFRGDIKGSPVFSSKKKMKRNLREKYSIKVLHLVITRKHGF